MPTFAPHIAIVEDTECTRLGNDDVLAKMELKFMLNLYNVSDVCYYTIVYYSPSKTDILPYGISHHLSQARDRHILSKMMMVYWKCIALRISIYKYSIALVLLSMLPSQKVFIDT